MSNEFLLSLAAIAGVLLVIRLLAPAVPHARLARRVTPGELVLAVAGVAGLVLHCGAMFFGSVVAAIPGTGSVIAQINAMGTASILWYVLPAALLLAGLRRQQLFAVVVLAVALLAVGVTMYNGAPLATHLVTIYAAAVVIAAIMFLLVLPPRFGRPGAPAKPVS
ncbi:hypothetical protein [Pseudarthrobacter sp. PH31-O2]|uniref:hypothetical protein n=1 Tax=Pseudarthrobacter sp. PH31-O2 TaxID=3046206 RepID=UPI0024B9A1BB|nr:hypothetical protein [Pseudarthrobacter sp. PH31-O2]MDJ0351441.1 hypothetical protein [Pseudarthrobacter sp. PH31-O2]